MEHTDLTYAFRKGCELNFYEVDKEGEETFLKGYHSYHFDKIFIPRRKDKIIIFDFLYRVKDVVYRYNDTEDYF